MIVRRIAAGALAAAAAAVVYVLACGPFVEEMPTVAVVEPANLAAYAKGNVGVVRPRLARRYLVQAYRVLSGKPPLPLSTLRPELTAPAASTSAAAQKSAADQWIEVSTIVAGPAAVPTGHMKKVPGDLYQEFLNCPDSAFDNAVHTLRARTERYGEKDAYTLAWTRAQQVVFANCQSAFPAIPEALPATANPILRADRDYQIASAWFYTGQYDEAARRFRLIAGDTESPWRIYGRYLAGRAMIRAATVPAHETPEQTARMERSLAAAELELKAVLADPSAAPVHTWARQLLDFIAARIHPVERLHELSRTLATSNTPSSAALDDYQWQMDHLVGDTMEYAYAGPRTAEMIDGDDLTDWVLAMQGEGDGAAERAVSRWQATHATPWLVAAMWRLTGRHAAAPAIVDAAAAVDRASAAYATVTFLRVRLLAQLDRRDEAKRVLSSLPKDIEQGADAEIVNLMRAERVMLADSLDEFLANMPRRVVMNETALAVRNGTNLPSERPVAGDDAALALNDWFPLDRLVDAGVSPALPPRLRARVASMALARAIVLGRDEDGVRVAPVVASLAPPVRADIDRYLKAPTADERRVAGLYLLLRTPGMHVLLNTPDDDVSFDVKDEPTREFDRLLHRNLWCALDVRIAKGQRGVGSSEMVGLLYPGRRVPAPSFITVEERAAADREMRQIAALGAMRSYLGAEALKWAREKRQDVEVAEALALTVQQWHFGCGDDEKWDIARQAFTVLHRQFPQSAAAKRTPYWYK